MRKIKHLFDFSKIIAAYLISRVLKVYKRNIWLVSERENEAEDNGYHLYKYIRENYPKEEVYYLINERSKSYERIKKYEKMINYNSFKHYIYYFLSSKHISAFQFFGVPNAPIIEWLEGKGYFKKRRIFLQHGVIKEYLPNLYYEKTKFDLFVCGAKKEYHFVQENFGYPPENVKYLGLSRYDALHEKKELKNQIILMPTWRKWLDNISWGGEQINNTKEIIESEYYKTYQSLINNDELCKILEEKNYEILFYLHPEIQKIRTLFSTQSKNIKILNREDVFLQDILKESKILITDYSSIGFEFGYLRRPVIYYQFDRERYHQNHFQKGYFEGERDGFGPVIKKELELITELKNIIEDKFNKEKYIKRAEEFFPLYDEKNCERTYQAIKNIS